jgi:predicted Rdx family selenoprotein
VSAISDLLSTYQHVISETRLLHGSSGIFDVAVDGEMLYSKFDVGRHANPGEVLDLFREKYGVGVPEYGT